MLNNLPTDKHYILLTAHNCDYECKFIVLQNAKPIVKNSRFV